MFCWLQGQFFRDMNMNVFVIQFYLAPSTEPGIVLDAQTLKLIRHSPYPSWISKSRNRCGKQIILRNNMQRNCH